MKKEFTIVWLGVALILFVTEWFLPPELQDSGRIFALMVGGPGEAWAIGRPKEGDSLTEHVKAFYAAEKARISLVVGMAVYLPVAMANIVIDPDLMIGRWPLTVAIITVAFMGWLIPHFLLKAKKV